MCIVDPLIHSGSLASFRIGDAMAPEAMVAVRFAGPELIVRGRVTYLSDSGQRKNHFAIVEVSGVPSPVVVPVACLQLEDAPAGTPRHRLRLMNDEDRSYEVTPRLDQA